MTTGLQQQYAPESQCFGCGPANAKGLKISSVPDGDHLVALWTPEPHHEAFPGVLNGGIVGALLDCHSNWTAAWRIQNEDGLDRPPCCVTAEFSVKLLRPTPSTSPLKVIAKATHRNQNRVTVEAQIESEGKIRATCTGLFVSVGPGHPGYHRW